MSALDSFIKQPFESYKIEGRFANVLESGETIVLGSSTGVAEDKDGNDATSTVLDLTNKAISDTANGLVFRVQAGSVDASPYKVSFRITTSGGNKWELDVLMYVKEL